MNFLDGSLFPENQQKRVITAAPYGPERAPEDFPADIPVTMDEQIQKAVDCYNAGATVLHLHAREDDGKGSKRLSRFNELLAGIHAVVPQMIIQVGGPISFSPEEGQIAKWLSDDTRHMLAELEPRPDQVTIAINTSQMNIIEQMCEADLAGTSLAAPANYHAYREMTIPAGPEWVEEHVRRLSANGVQTHFQLAGIAQLETVERMMRRGVCNVPLILTWVAIGGGFDAPNLYNLANFVRACPEGSVLTLDLHAERAAGQHDGDRDGHARALRHRRQPLDAASRTQDRLGRADRATRTHRARMWSRRGQLQRSTRDLPDRHVLQKRRRNARSEWLRAEPRNGSTRLGATSRLSHPRSTARAQANLRTGISVARRANRKPRLPFTFRSATPSAPALPGTPSRRASAGLA